MVAHTKEFGLLTYVEVIAEVLLIGSFIQGIDKILKQFAGTVRCDLMAYLNACLSKKLSAMIRGVEHKGEIVQTEGFFVVVTIHQVVILALLHGQDHHIIRDKGEEDLTARLTDSFCLFNALQSIRFLV